ncbi:MAG: type II toxin-antitoxin system VapB family antitoxin [Phormidesmis sp. CAN_BIN36]|nr:type II toxin-antitoxin system VapB family antitoxin [Phormidesmis sp. CAN_BIN36]
MKTTILIDDQLVNEALEATGLATQEEVVALGLKTLIKLKQQSQIKQFKGKLKWEGDLDEMRLNG